MATAAEKMSAFAVKYSSAAAAAAAGSKIFPQTILTAAALESSYGESGLTIQANNFFGVKAGSSWTGPTVTMPTKEQKPDGTVYTVNAAFRKYTSPEASFKDYVKLLSTSRYVNAGVTSAKTPEQQFAAIKKAGYATDVNYVSKLNSIYSSIKNMTFDFVKAHKKALVVTSTAAGLILLGVGLYLYFRNSNK